MKKVLVLSVLLLAIICVAPALALDNAGGGYWKKTDVFPFTNTISTPAQYCIDIQGNYIKVENSTGAVKQTLYDPSFWSLVNSTGADIRITNQSSQLYFWIQTFNPAAQKARIWINVTPGSGEICMYYDNPDALPSVYNNPYKVFVFYQNFSTNTSLTGWTDVLGTWGVSNGLLTVLTSYTTAPGNIIISVPVNGPFVVYTKMYEGSSEGGILIYNSTTNLYTASIIQSLLFDGLKILQYTGTWYTISSTAYSYTTGSVADLQLIYTGNELILKDLTHGVSTSTAMTLSSQYYIGFHNSIAQSPFASFANLTVCYYNDPAIFGTPFVENAGHLVQNATVVNVTYHSYDYTGLLMINNSTALLSPTFVYVPSTSSSTGYLATGTATVPGLANITIYLASNMTLNTVICNGTIVTPTYLGTNITNNITYNVYNFTSPSAGTLIVTANVTPVVREYNTAVVHFIDLPELPFEFGEYIPNVNATYGANVSFMIPANFDLTNVTLSNTPELANTTYEGVTIYNGITYKKYNLTIYSSGYLDIKSNTTNVALNTTISVNGDTNATFSIVGETINAKPPTVATIYFNSVEYTNVTSASITPMIPTTEAIVVDIFNTTDMVFGYHKITLPVEWGSINLRIESYINNTTYPLQVAYYNTNYSKLSYSNETLYAGLNKITAYYLGIPVSTIYVMLSHNNTGTTVTMFINATKECTNYSNMTIISSSAFSVVNLSKTIPFGKFAVNHSSEVIISFADNPPSTVTVSGGEYSYYAPYLYLYGSGNSTVVVYYTIKTGALNTLGLPIEVPVKINSKTVNVYGNESLVLPVDRYSIVYPTNVMGFVLKNTANSTVQVNLTRNIALPEMVYKVPTYVTMSAFKINTTSWNWWFLPFPLPFSTHTAEYNQSAPCAEVTGTLYNWYNAPVPHANLTVSITSLKTGYTITKEVNTSDSGTYTVLFNVSNGVTYKISVRFSGNDIYVGSSKELTIKGGQLPRAPPQKIEYGVVVLTAAVITLCISLVVLAAVLRKKSTKAAIRSMEKNAKFFRRIK